MSVLKGSSDHLSGRSDNSEEIVLNISAFILRRKNGVYNDFISAISSTAFRFTLNFASL